MKIKDYLLSLQENSPNHTPKPDAEVLQSYQEYSKVLRLNKNKKYLKKVLQQSK